MLLIFTSYRGFAIASSIIYSTAKSAQIFLTVHVPAGRVPSWPPTWPSTLGRAACYHSTSCTSSKVGVRLAQRYCSSESSTPTAILKLLQYPGQQFYLKIRIPGMMYFKNNCRNTWKLTKIFSNRSSEEASLISVMFQKKMIYVRKIAKTQISSEDLSNISSS